MEHRERDGMVWGAFGAIAAIAIAGVLVPVRSTIDNTNVALILVLVVVAAATFGGRTAGAVTSIVSALAFNYFQTEPYYTLRISDRDDIVTAVLLLVVGLAVGEIAVLSRRRQVVVVEHVTGARQLERVTALLAQGAGEGEVWTAVRDGIVLELGLKSCHFEPGGGLRHLPRIEHDGRLLEGEKFYTGGGFALPPEGAEIMVEREGAPIGRLVLEPSHGRAVSRDQRRIAVALADSLAVVVGRSGALRALA